MCFFSTFPKAYQEIIDAYQSYRHPHSREHHHHHPQIHRHNGKGGKMSAARTVPKKMQPQRTAAPTLAVLFNLQSPVHVLVVAFRPFFSTLASLVLAAQ